MGLSQSIELAKQFGLWLHERTNERSRPGGVRNRTAESILQQSLDINDGILILLDHKLPGAALALARPLFECYVRGVWLGTVASDRDIEDFNNGQGPSLDKVLRAIPDEPETVGEWIHSSKKKNFRMFNDLAHGGSEHVWRRNTQDAVEPNYPDSELEKLVRFGIEVRIRIGVEQFTLMNDEIGMQQLCKEAENLRKFPQ